jgi:putative flavoprotein involved in K+ transport
MGFAPTGLDPAVARPEAQRQTHRVSPEGGNDSGLRTAERGNRDRRRPGRACRRLLILDASQRLGDSWRRRWDSLELFTVARYSALPGLKFPGDPEHFPGKDEVGDYLESYARRFELPVRLNSPVSSLDRSDGGYRLETGPGPNDLSPYEATQVIVASGAYQRPRVPALAEKLGNDVTQLHSAEYRNPEQLPAGDILVVGAANSGAGIAEDLAATHRVYLSQGSRVQRMPRRILGKSLYWWGDHLGLIGAPLDSLRGRTQRGDVLVGQSLRQLARRHGVELIGRTVDADGRTVLLEGDRTIEVDAVIWATGYRSDYSWIRVPGLRRAGRASPSARSHPTPPASTSSG